MTTLTVKADGTGDYTTIAAAISAAGTDDIIEIQDSSVYAESGMSISDPNLQVIATGSNTPTIRNNGSANTFHLYVSGCYFQNINFYGPDAGGYCIGRGNYRGTAFSVSGCFFEGHINTPFEYGIGKHTSGFYYTGAPDAAIGKYPGANPYCMIDRCVFIHTGSGGNQYIIAQAQYGGYVLVRNSLIVSNFTDHPGLYLWGATAQANTTTASFCTIITTNENFDDGWIIHKFGKVNNCIVSSSSTHPDAAAIAANDHTYNLVSLGQTNLYNGYDYFWADASLTPGTGGVGDIQGPVYFKDPANFDFRLDIPTCSAVPAANLKAYYKFTPSASNFIDNSSQTLKTGNITGSLYDYSGNGYQGYLSYWFDPAGEAPQDSSHLGPASSPYTSWEVGYTPNRPSGGLALYFKMENSGSTALTDYSNYGHAGTFSTNTTNSNISFGCPHQGTEANPRNTTITVPPLWSGGSQAGNLDIAASGNYSLFLTASDGGTLDRRYSGSFVHVSASDQLNLIGSHGKKVTVSAWVFIPTASDGTPMYCKDDGTCDSEGSIYSGVVVKNSRTVAVGLDSTYTSVPSYGLAMAGAGSYGLLGAKQRFVFEVLQANSLDSDLESNYAMTTGTLALNKWIHIAGVYDATAPVGNIKMYYDGVLQGYDTFISSTLSPSDAGDGGYVGGYNPASPTFIASNSSGADKFSGVSAGGDYGQVQWDDGPSGSLTIGCKYGVVKSLFGGTACPNSESYNYFFKGFIDEVAIWSEALNHSQIKELYNSGNPFDARSLAAAGTAKWEIVDHASRPHADRHVLSFNSGTTSPTTFFGTGNNLTADVAYVVVPGSGSNNSAVGIDSYPISVSYWVKPYPIRSALDSSTTKVCFYLHLTGAAASPAHIAGGFRYESNGNYVCGVSNLYIDGDFFEFGKWHHITHVKTADSVAATQLYLNGILRSETGYNNPIRHYSNLASSSAYIGPTASYLGAVNTVYDAGAGNWTTTVPTMAFIGEMDELSIWNVALTPNQVWALWNRGQPKRDIENGLPATLIENYAINSGYPEIGSSSADESLNPNNVFFPVSNVPNYMNQLSGGLTSSAASTSVLYTNVTPAMEDRGPYFVNIAKPLFSGFDRGCYASPYRNILYGRTWKSSLTSAYVPTYSTASCASNIGTAIYGLFDRTMAYRDPDSGGLYLSASDGSSGSLPCSESFGGLFNSGSAVLYRMTAANFDKGYPTGSIVEFYTGTYGGFNDGPY